MSEQQWAKAVMKSQHASAQKVRLVADSVRGVSVESALEQLAYHPSKHAALVKKTLESAMANAENNYALDIDELIVQSFPAGLHHLNIPDDGIIATDGAFVSAFTGSGNKLTIFLS